MPKLKSMSLNQAINNLTETDSFDKEITRDMLKKTLESVSSSLQHLSIAPFNSLSQCGSRTKESNELAQILAKQLHTKILKRVRR